MGFLVRAVLSATSGDDTPSRRLLGELFQIRIGAFQIRIGRRLLGELLLQLRGDAHAVATVHATAGAVPSKLGSVSRAFDQFGLGSDLAALAEKLSKRTICQRYLSAMALWLDTSP